MWQEAGSNRALADKAMFCDALIAIQNGKSGYPPAFSYLITERKAKLVTMAALGRIGDPATIRAAATEICTRKMNTVQAVAFCKRLRRVEPKPGSVEALVDVLLAAFNAYRRRHPLDWEAGIEAAEWFARSVSKSAEAAE